jgi:hypothetical protein
MTLILTCLTEEYIVQVSDRRLTTVDRTGKIIKVADEASNKAVFLDHKWIIGFTGLAKLSGTRADKWLAEQLVDTAALPFVSRLKEVARALPGAVAYAPEAARLTAFVGAGFARINNGAIRPTEFHIANYLDANGKPGPLTSEFAVRVKPLKPHQDFAVMEAGVHLFESNRRQLRQSIRSARKRSAGPVEIARLLADAIWCVSTYSSGVGDRLMICLLPRKAVNAAVAGADAFVSGGIRINPDQASFFYLGPETSELVQFGPTVVSPGMILSDIEMRFGTKDRPAEPPPEIAKIHYQGPNGSKTPPDALCPCGSGKAYRGCHDQS